MCRLINPAISDNLCQVTRGAEPKFADTPYAQWIKRRLEELGWQKQDLAARMRDESGGRLGGAGAEAVVRRATHGHNITRANRDLIAQILGPSEVAEAQEADLQARLEELAVELENVKNSLHLAGLAHDELLARVKAVEEQQRGIAPRAQPAAVASSQVRRQR